MIVDDNFVGKLRQFGLNSYEAKLWVALRSRQVSNAGELSDIASVPRSRAYDVLESLEKKGFIVMKVGKPIQYIAIEPEEVLERVKKQVERDSVKHAELLEEFRQSTLLEELNLLYKQGVDMINPADVSGAIKGRQNMYDHLNFMVKNAKKSIVLSTTAKGLVRKGAALRNTLKKAQKRGVAIRVVAPISKENKEIADELSSIGQVRHTGDDSRFCIVDNDQLLFMLNDDKEVHPGYDTAVWVTTPYFTQSFSRMFEDQWKGLKPYQ
ncbi:hypothetical protein COY95_04550 [Candidatus Woesearchaeota archaeon CG_4_10_14_0_8_um_filter_47_5]|nr:MAG: hypothetical protein COY95_04550 [Candidatus Woesearchaeota archaeon CG_4_10_14_0_8_um_filter_47_5]